MGWLISVSVGLKTRLVVMWVFAPSFLANLSSATPHQLGLNISKITEMALENLITTLNNPKALTADTLAWCGRRDSNPGHRLE